VKQGERGTQGNNGTTSVWPSRPRNVFAQKARIAEVKTKKKTPAFKGSVSSGGEKMRRTRSVFYVTYLIVSQLSAQSTANFLVSISFTSDPVVCSQ
jgi:hypothetical protein